MYFYHFTLVNVVTCQKPTGPLIYYVSKINCTACGGSLTAEHGQFTSPRYPDAYIGNVECVWNTSVSPGNRLRVAFRYRVCLSVCHKSVLFVTAMGKLFIHLCTVSSTVDEQVTYIFVTCSAVRLGSWYPLI